MRKGLVNKRKAWQMSMSSARRLRQSGTINIMVSGKIKKFSMEITNVWLKSSYFNNALVDVHEEAIIKSRNFISEGLLRSKRIKEYSKFFFNTLQATSLEKCNETISRDWFQSISIRTRRINSIHSFFTYVSTGNDQLEKALLRFDFSRFSYSHSSRLMSLYLSSYLSTPTYLNLFNDRKFIVLMTDELKQ